MNNVIYSSEPTKALTHTERGARCKPSETLRRTTVAMAYAIRREHACMEPGDDKQMNEIATSRRKSPVSRQTRNARWKSIFAWNMFSIRCECRRDICSIPHWILCFLEVNRILSTRDSFPMRISRSLPFCLSTERKIKSERIHYARIRKIQYCHFINFVSTHQIMWAKRKEWKNQIQFSLATRIEVGTTSPWHNPD